MHMPAVSPLTSWFALAHRIHASFQPAQHPHSTPTALRCCSGTKQCAVRLPAHHAPASPIGLHCYPAEAPIIARRTRSTVPPTSTAPTARAPCCQICPASGPTCSTAACWGKAWGACRTPSLPTSSKHFAYGRGCGVACRAAHMWVGQQCTSRAWQLEKQPEAAGTWVVPSGTCQDG